MRLIETFLEGNNILVPFMDAYNSSIYLNYESRRIVKVVNKKFAFARNEIAVYEKLMTAKVEGVPRYYGYLEVDTYYIIVMEEVGKDGLEICNDGTITHDMYIQAITQMICTVETLHRVGIIHRDIKLDNIAYSKQHGWKLFDFGLSEIGKSHKYLLLGTLPYILPEFLTKTIEMNTHTIVYNDYFATALTLLALKYPYFTYHCSNCHYDKSPCAHDQSKTIYIRVNVRDIYDLKENHDCPKIQKVLVLLRNLVLRSLANCYEYVIWNKKEALFEYFNPCDLMIFDHEGSIESLWEKIVNTVNQSCK